MSTNQHKRITRQARISDKWHTYLKLQAAVHGTTISKLLDKACECFSGEMDRNREKIEEKLAILFPKKSSAEVVERRQNRQPADFVDKINNQEKPSTL